ncbi:MAG: DUF7453 family protein [Phycisphaerales bacterium]
MRRSTTVCIIAMAAAAFTGTGTAAAQTNIRLRVIAKVGDPAPALGPGRVISSVGTPSVADSGLVAYTIADEIEGALVVANVADPTSKRVAIREAMIPHTLFSLQTITQHHILGDGRVAVVGLISGSTLPAGASGAMIETASGPALTAFAGMGYVGDGSYLGSISACRVNPSGAMLVVGTLTGAGLGFDGPQVLLRIEEGPFGNVVTPLLRSGEPLSPIDPGVVVLCDLSGIALNASGIALAPVLVQRAEWPEPRTVLVMQAPGSAPVQVLAPGEAFVLDGASFTVTSILDASLNNTGTLAFTAAADCSALGLIGAPVVGRISQPLGTGRVVTIDSVGGQQLGGTPAGTSLAVAHFVWSVTPDEALVNGLAGGAGVNSSNDLFLAAGSDRNLTSVLREGDPGPELPPGVMIAYLSGAIAVGPDGYAAISADLAGPDFQQSNRFALFLITPSGQVRLAARFGQMVQLSPTLAMPLRGFAFNARSNGQDGRPRSLARGGRLYFRADFDDGMFAIMEASHSGCNAADVASLGGAPGPDALLTADDVVVFLSAFFAGEVAVADVGSLGGQAAPDGELTVDDVVVFLAAFFSGCQ